MENIQLIKQGEFQLIKKEKDELKKRGFFVKNYFSYLYILTSILLYSGFFIYIGLFGVLEYTLILLLDLPLKNDWILYLILTPMWLMGLRVGYMLLRTIFYYIFLGKVFYIKKGVFFYGKLYDSITEIKYLEFVSGARNLVNRNSPLKIKELSIGSPDFKWIALLLPVLFPIFLFLLVGNSSFKTYALIMLGGYVAVAGLIYALRQLVEHFHPLYFFGNIGEKIQKLTPQIEEKSKQIQSEFQSDMNYSVLSNGFDSLSATFSEIITLVIKLEKVETQANKGNLFDSEKYINSLRSDITTPLTSLKIFLEKQKSELMNSQKELTKVRVGSNESSGNIKLQSKRSEPLIQELTENIEKLDAMIGKIGE